MKGFDFRSVEIPPKMSNLDKDGRGYPIPWNVLRDEKTNRPYFTINDDSKYVQSIKERTCAICGSELADDMWFVGGVKSAFHNQGVFIDSPVHYECGNYSLKVCPYLATSRYMSYLGEDKIEKLQKKVETHLLVDPTVDPKKPEVFALVKTRNYNLVESDTANSGFYLKPERPYLNIELYKAGQIIFPIMIKQIIERNECVLMPGELKI